LVFVLHELMSTPKQLDSEFPTASNGARILAITGLVLGALTVAGAVLRYVLGENVLWVTIWYYTAISGLVGFGTNWVAIKMLFHPRVKVLGVQGVVPARRLELARSIGETLEEHLISGDRMHKLLVGSGAVDEAMDKLAKHLPRLLDDEGSRELITREVRETIQETMGDVIVAAKSKLKEKARSNFSAVVAGSTAAMSLGPLAGVMAAGAMKSGMLDGIVDRLIDNMADEIRKDGGVDGAARGIVKALPARAEQILADHRLRARLTELFEGMASDLVNAVDVAGLVEQELLGRDENELEALIDRVASNELVFIQVAGGALGMIAGLALIWPWLLLPVSVVFLILVLIARMAEKKHTANREAENRAIQPAKAPSEPSALTEQPLPEGNGANDLAAGAGRSEPLPVAAEAP
jgi:uncharacterized membrane-anchored protein YjiN (DUF445 family)